MEISKAVNVVSSVISSHDKYAADAWNAILSRLTAFMLQETDALKKVEKLTLQQSDDLMDLIMKELKLGKATELLTKFIISKPDNKLLEETISFLETIKNDRMARTKN